MTHGIGGRVSCTAKWISIFIIAAGLPVAVTVPTLPEELRNLEIIFKKTYDGYIDGVRDFGSDICSVGDVNGDGYEDFAAQGWEYDLAWRSLVFVFLGEATLDTIPYAVLRDDYWGGTPDGRLAGGDVNGDGYSDVVVGLPMGPGNVDIYFGGNPMDTIVDLCFTETPPEEYFGCAVATGDINGDGYCDIVAADYMKDDKGAVYVYYGGPLLDQLPDVKLNGHGYEGFGVSVGSGGDVNGDGYDDVIVGAWGNSDLFYMGGAIYVYCGGNPMDTIFDVRMYGEGTSHCLGWQGVAICRNQSTYDYVVAGTPFWPDGFPITGSGKLYVLLGGDPMDGIPDLLMYGTSPNSGLGECTRYAGDINGDGYGDLICGAATENPWGIAYIWLGGASMDDTPDASMRGDSMHASVGFRVASAGDVDGDGRDEVMVSHYPSSSDWHSVWVCKYTGTGVTESPDHWPSFPSRVRTACSPNPFRTETSILFDLPETSHVTLSIYDITGRLVETLVNETQQPGIHQVQWNRKTNPSGVYFYRLRAGEFVETRKIVVLD
jgi:hypothetical protein